MTEHEALLERYSNPIRDSLGKQSEAIDRMASAISEMARAIAVSEEKHSNTADALARLGGRIDDHESRMRALEKSDAEQGFIAQNAGKFTWSAVGVALAMILSYLFGPKG